MQSDFQDTQADAQTVTASQATEQAQPGIRKGQAKSRAEIVHEAAIKKAVAVEMMDAGASLSEITAAIGYTRKSKTIQLLERGGIKVARRLINECKAHRAIETETDPAGLTEEQIERANALGITPGRFAWLLSCPRTLSVYSHAAPGNAYTRNIL
jgi:hypothetical protein